MPYTYDLVGNRLSSLNLSPYTYNSSNELLSTPSGSYTYDKDGEMLTRDGTQFSWDYENRLTQAVLPSGGGTVTFYYDPFGRRIQKSGPLGTTNYLYDGRNILETADQNANVLARYADTQSLDEPLAELASGTTGYYEQDGLGTVTSLSDVNGNPANTYTYDSFGNLTASTGTITNPFQYTGREFDQESGIYEYRARYYDQGVGRFASEDPRRFNEGVNFYRYVGNSPINLADPSGLATANCFCELAGPLQPTLDECLYNCTCNDDIFVTRTVLFRFGGPNGLKNRCGAKLSCPKTVRARKRTLFGVTVYVPDTGTF